MADRAVERIWSGDATFWKIEAIARRRIEASLGWLTLPDRGADRVSEIRKVTGPARSGTERLLVLASGGAARAASLFAGCFAPARGAPAVEVLETTDPAAVARAAARSDPSRTLFLVASRTGRDLTTPLLFDFFLDHARKELGDRAPDRFLAVTDPGSALDREASVRGIRHVFHGDPRVPDAFGALSAYGLVPASFLGLDLDELVARARRMAEACRAGAAENPGLLLGAALGAEATSGRDKLTLSLGDPLGGLGGWIELLVAHTTGQDGRGIVPLADAALSRPESYGLDRVFVRYETRGFEDPASARRGEALVAHGHPLISFVLQDPLDVAAEAFRWEFAAVVAASLLGVDPFDVADLRDVDAAATAILSGDPPAGAPSGWDDAATLSALVGSIRPRDYVALLGYVPETGEALAELRAMAARIQAGRRVAALASFGPRALPALGPLHRGGPPNGVYLLLVGQTTEPLPIPDRPWGFPEVTAALAEADLATLRDRGRRTVRLRVAADTALGLREVSGLLDRALLAAAPRAPGAPGEGPRPSPRSP